MFYYFKREFVEHRLIVLFIGNYAILHLVQYGETVAQGRWFICVDDISSRQNNARKFYKSYKR